MMKKIVVGLSVIAIASGCNMLKKTGDTGDGGTATADSDAGSPQVSAVDKALSFLGGSGTFEGEITMNMTEGTNPPHVIAYDVKGTKMRFDAPAAMSNGGGGYMIFDSSTKKITTINDAQKMAMVMDMNAASATANANLTSRKPVIDKTGKMDTIAGYSCEIWKTTHENGDKGELCVAKGIAFPSIGRGASWLADVGDFFPLRAITTDPAGKEKNRMEVTKIDKKSLDDSKFEVPAGYKTMSMDDMMKGMGGMGGMGGMHGRPPH